MVKFFVKNKIYTIEKNLILDHPRGSYLKNLIKYQEEGSIYVDTKNDAIVLEEENKIFELLLYIYKNGTDYLNLISDNNLIDRLLFYDIIDRNIVNEQILKNSHFIENNYYNNYVDKINNFGINVEKLDTVLRKFSGVIAGSFTLQCILDKKWDSDIDIYFNENLIELLHYDDYTGKSFLLKSLMECFDDESNTGIEIKLLDQNKKKQTHIRKNINIYEEAIEIYEEAIEEYKRIDDEETEKPKLKYGSGYGFSGNIKNIIMIKNENVKLDLIFVSCTPKFFISEFDFDFCRCYYDGYVFNSLNWGSILNRQSYNNYAPDRFNISEQDKYELNIDRIKKYRQRGFEILVRPDDNELILK